MTPRDAATEAQVRAADPGHSTWLSANAGSGKTRVLTNRVARLLFDEVEPQNILCLTYTKAAASEMQNRLFGTLGRWAMMPDAALRGELTALGVERALIDDDLRRARTLFARAIETPGGLRIQTIHSFCAGILRRFPLEAGVSPQFSEIDDATGRALRATVMEEMSLTRADLVGGVASYLTSGDFDDLLRAVDGRREMFRAPLDEAALAHALDLPKAMTEDALIDQTFGPGDRAALQSLHDICAHGSSTEAKAATAIAAALEGDAFTLDAIASLESVFLYGASAKTPFGAKIGKFPTQGTQKAHVDLMNQINPLMERIEDARPLRLALAAAQRSRALHAFAHDYTRRYEAAKLTRGLLDFSDQIAKARALLLDPAVAQWVLFRLDGGIDHILVDEAQDTSPEQWDVVRSLAAEFAAGEGARAERERTIFVVGDKKQSIYSFQGADPEEFDRMAAHFQTALQDAGKDFLYSELQHSFRSSAAVLGAVDMTFQREAAEGLSRDPVKHLAFFADMPGRVDLWPVIPPPPKEKPSEEPAWFAPVDTPSPEHPVKQLAREIAGEIRRMIDTGETIPDPDRKGHRRPVTEGDFLILVRGRGERSTVSLFSEIIRACKAADLNIAGADRLRVGAELAVRDIVALLRFLALPEDDLALATALRSPLFGWSEQDLYRLAQPRGNRLVWQALRAEAETGMHGPTMEILRDMRANADFMRPFDLIDRLLVRHDGRRRLLARLGAEAKDGIDALLGQALRYETGDIPSLTGFLQWLAADELEIKRQMDTASDQLQVMTVHGAKGLERPIVILPQTTKPRNSGRVPVVLKSGEQPLWATPKAQMPPAMTALSDAVLDAGAREDRRLLYVAMTRAQSWLIVCGAGEAGTGLESWHGMISAGMEHVGATDAAFPTGPGKRYGHGDWHALPLTPAQSAAMPPAAPPPAPLGSAAPPGAPGGTRSPSDLGGDKALPGETIDDDRDLALARGRLLHRLLEYLPEIAAADRADFAAALVQSDPDAAGLDTAALIADAQRILAEPALAPLFAPGTLAEVAVSGILPATGERLHGAIDRLIITGDVITAVDYKSNRLTPNAPSEVPEGLLRQLGAYRALIEQIWPDKRAEVAILWTATGALMPLPGPLVAAALDRVTAP